MSVDVILTSANTQSHLTLPLLGDLHHASASFLLIAASCHGSAGMKTRQNIQHKNYNPIKNVTDAIEIKVGFEFSC